MLLLFKMLNKFITLLNSETAPTQLAAGVCFGLIIGFSPFFTWHNLIIFLLVCLFRVNFAMFFLSSAVFALLAFALDPVFDWLGYYLLVDVASLRPLWIYISSAPVLPFFRLNNTVILGSLVVGLVSFIPLFILSTWAVHRYRKSWREKIKNSKAVKALKATKIYGICNNLYQKYASIREKWERIS